MISAIDPIDIQQERTVGIEVDAGYGRVRPIWRMIVIRIPDGEITAEKWDAMSYFQKKEYLSKGSVDD